jgi:hypothetical protein
LIVATVGRNLRSSGLDSSGVSSSVGNSDPHAAQRQDGAILEARERFAVGPAQVGGIAREFRLRHALEKYRLAEIELVVAGYEYVGRHHVCERHDVGALVDAR